MKIVSRNYYLNVTYVVRIDCQKQQGVLVVSPEVNRYYKPVRIVRARRNSVSHRVSLSVKTVNRVVADIFHSATFRWRLKSFPILDDKKCLARITLPRTPRKPCLARL